MNGILKAAAAAAALVSVGYLGYRQGSKVMDNIAKQNLHRIAGRYGDPTDPTTYAKPAPSAGGAK